MNPTEFEKRMHKAAQEWRNPRDLLAIIGRAVKGAVDARTPVKSGHLRHSNYARVESRDRLLIGNTASYAKFVEEGTRFMQGRHFQARGIEDVEHRIEAEMLKFGTKIWGEVGKG